MLTGLCALHNTEVFRRFGESALGEVSGQTLGLHWDPMSYQASSGGPYCCLGVVQPNDRRTFNSILSDIWNISINWDYWAVFSVCQLL